MHAFHSEGIKLSRTAGSQRKEVLYVTSHRVTSV